MIIAFLAACASVNAQYSRDKYNLPNPPEGKSAENCIPGAVYPCVDDQHRATFVLNAPKAQSVAVDICSKVYVIHRREEFRGDAEKQKRLFARENVEKITNVSIRSLDQANGELKGLTVADNETGKQTFVSAEALFVAIGSEPALESFRNVLTLDRKGYAVAGEEGCTDVEGLFVAGDCRAKSVRQLTTAVGDGANAALQACRFLEA